MSAMNEKQPLLGASRPSARQTTSAWPLDRHQIWQGLTNKAIWIEAVTNTITMIIVNACLSPTSMSFADLCSMAFIFVSGYIVGKVIMIPLLDSFFKCLFGLCFPCLRRRAHQPILPLHRLDLRPEDIIPKDAMKICKRDQLGCGAGIQNGEFQSTWCVKH